MKSITYLALLLALSCTHAPYDYVSGAPRLNLTNSSRMSMVGKLYQLKYTLLGRLPDPNQPVAIVLKVWYDERAIGISTITQRMNTFNLTFTDLDFYESIDKLRGSPLGDTYIERNMQNPESFRSLSDLQNDSGTVPISIEIWLVDPHPIDSTRWVKTKLWVSKNWRVKLTCPHCLM